MKRQGWQFIYAIGLITLSASGCRSLIQDASPRPHSATTDDAYRSLAAQRIPVDKVASQADEGEAAAIEGLLVSLEEETPQLLLPAPKAEPELLPPGENANQLSLREVIASVQQSYPLLVAALLERDIAAGNEVSANGEFDLGLKGFSIAAPQGFYKNYRTGFGVEKPLYNGGYLYGGYKIGNGNFQPWFKERETNQAGEFSLGFGVPLLKNRVIDERRADVMGAQLARQAVEPAAYGQMIEFVRAASEAYWKWVAAGQALLAQQELLENAEERVEQIEERVKAGDLERIERINNEQLIAARETKLIEARRKVQMAAIKLSLFMRDAAGQPAIPPNSTLPTAFPDQRPPKGEDINTDIAAALAASPYLAEINLVVEQLRVQLEQAENSLLPKLDARVLASKDIGEPTKLGDKTPFELEAGLFGEVPLQRRKAKGKITTLRGKLAQVNAKREFIINKTTAAVQDALSELRAAYERITRATTNERLARQTLELGRVRFDVGDVDLVQLNIYEKAVTDAQFLLIAAQADYFTALANYRAALAIDPQQVD